MVVKRTINIGFRANFVTFELGKDLKMPIGLAVENGFPFNPTYDAVKILYRSLQLLNETWRSFLQGEEKTVCIPVLLTWHSAGVRRLAYWYAIG